MQKQTAKSTHQTEWEEISRRQRLTALGDGHPATFESTTIPNTAPLIHVPKGATTTASGSDDIPEAGFGNGSSEDDCAFTVPVSQSMPTHSLEIQDLKLLLQHLLTFYTINAVRANEGGGLLVSYTLNTVVIVS